MKAKIYYIKISLFTMPWSGNEIIRLIEIIKIAHRADAFSIDTLGENHLIGSGFMHAQ